MLSTQLRMLLELEVEGVIVVMGVVVVAILVGVVSDIVVVAVVAIVPGIVVVPVVAAVSRIVVVVIVRPGDFRSDLVADIAASALVLAVVSATGVRVAV